MEGFAVTCPLAPDASRLISGFCSSPRDFALDFLCTPPHDDALVLWLTFGSADTWYRDLHPVEFVPCTAHTFDMRGAQKAQPFGHPLDGRVRPHCAYDQG